MWKHRSRYHSSSEEDHLRKNVPTACRHSFAEADTGYYTTCTVDANTIRFRHTYEAIPCMDSCFLCKLLFEKGINLFPCCNELIFTGFSSFTLDYRVVSSENKRRRWILRVIAWRARGQRRGRKARGENPRRRAQRSLRAPGNVRVNNGAHTVVIVVVVSSSIGVYLPSQWGLSLARGAPRIKIEKRRRERDASRDGKPGSSRPSAPSSIYSLGAKLRERCRVVSLIIFDKLVHSTCPRAEIKRTVVAAFLVRSRHRRCLEFIEREFRYTVRHF